jgi:hypothetical protein
MFLICESAVNYFQKFINQAIQAVFAFNISIDYSKICFNGFRNLAIAIFRQTQFHYGPELQ